MPLQQLNSLQPCALHAAVARSLSRSLRFQKKWANSAGLKCSPFAFNHTTQQHLNMTQITCHWFLGDLMFKRSETVPQSSTTHDLRELLEHKYKLEEVSCLAFVATGKTPLPNSNLQYIGSKFLEVCNLLFVSCSVLVV